MAEFRTSDGQVFDVPGFGMPPEGGQEPNPEELGAEEELRPEEKAAWEAEQAELEEYLRQERLAWEKAHPEEAAEEARQQYEEWKANEYPRADELSMLLGFDIMDWGDEDEMRYVYYDYEAAAEKGGRALRDWVRKMRQT